MVLFSGLTKGKRLSLVSVMLFRGKVGNSTIKLPSFIFPWLLVLSPAERSEEEEVGRKWGTVP